MCVKKSFDGTAFACGFLVEKRCRSQYFNKTGLLRNGLLMNQKKSGSCRCILRKLRVEQSSCNDITCFSNRSCDVVGSLVETALWLLSFSWEVLGGRVSPMKTQGSPWVVPGDHTRIVPLCHRPSGLKPEIQHNRRGRGMPILTWEEVTSREGKRLCCSCSKKEIIRLRNDSKLALNQRVKESVYHVESYTIPYATLKQLRWPTSPAEKAATYYMGVNVQSDHWTGSILGSSPYDLDQHWFLWRNLVMFKVSSAMRWWHLVSPPPQHWDVNLTHLASDLGLMCQKYHCMVDKYICTVHI